jgi:hypothetical protein
MDKVTEAKTMFKDSAAKCNRLVREFLDDARPKWGVGPDGFVLTPPAIDFSPEASIKAEQEMWALAMDGDIPGFSARSEKWFAGWERQIGRWRVEYGIGEGK